MTEFGIWKMFRSIYHWCQLLRNNWLYTYCKSSIKPPRAYLFQAHLRGGEGGGLFNLENMMVSVLHKDLEYKVEKLKYKKVEGHATED